ncbi:hypothetical protein [Streptomyces rhizosphaericus]|uniref:hypothetical protein n=1 Tax=Streptomyces rhizosphaericus TaxID=114699 RepID=UPI000A3C03D2|nr:hypothetical protein [Streptomyces rhizosphaericus]
MNAGYDALTAGATTVDGPPTPETPHHTTQTKAVVPFDADTTATACRTYADVPHAPCGEPVGGEP